MLFLSPENQGREKLRFEADLDFSRPLFSEVKVQMERQSVLKADENTTLKIISSRCDAMAEYYKRS